MDKNISISNVANFIAFGKSSNTQEKKLEDLYNQIKEL